MIAILMAAVVVTDMNDRPTLLVGQEGQAGYVAALDNKLATAPYLTAVENIVMPGCATLTYASKGFRELGLKDQLPDTFYKTMAQEPAVMESVLVSGCGKTLAVNVLSYRSFDNKLNFFVKYFGNTKAGIGLQDYAFKLMTSTLNGIYFAKHKPADCTTRANVVLDAEPQPGGNDDKWDEIWTQYYCGVTYRLDATFTREASGLYNVTFVVAPPS